MADSLCQQHGKPLVLCCSTCDGEPIVCLKCVVTNHQGHNFIELEELVPKRKDILKKQIEHAENTLLVNTRRSLIQLEKYSKTSSDFESAVKTRSKEIIAEVEKVAQEIIEDGRKTQKNEIDNLKTKVNTLQSQEREITTAIERTKTTLEKGTDLQIITCKPDLLQTTSSINAQVTVDDFFTVTFQSKNISKDTIKGMFGTLGKSKIKIEESDGKQSNVEDKFQTGVALSSDESDSDDSEEKGSDYLPPLSSLPTGSTEIASFRFPSSGIRTIIPLMPKKENGAWIWCSRKKTIRLTSMEGNISQTISVGTEIRDFVIDYGDNGNMWLVCTDDTIRKVTNNGSSNLVKFSTQNWPVSICLTRHGDLLVGTYKENGGGMVIKYGTDGKSKTSTELKSNWSLTKPYKVQECRRSGAIAIVDQDYRMSHMPKIVVLDSAFALKFEITSSQPSNPKKKSQSADNVAGVAVGGGFDPYDVCFDPLQNIIIADFASKSVIMYSKLGHFVKVVLVDQSAPRALGLASSGNLWVASEEKKVRIIHFY